MLAVNYSTLRNNLKAYCDKATDEFETVIVTRKNEKNVVIMSLEKYNNLRENLSALGTASFDVDEMPWSKDTLSEDVVFMMKIIEKAKSVEVAGKLDYRPDLRIVSPWLDQFSSMIWKLDKDYLY